MYKRDIRATKFNRLTAAFRFIYFCCTLLSTEYLYSPGKSGSNKKKQTQLSEIHTQMKHTTHQ